MSITYDQLELISKLNYIQLSTIDIRIEVNHHGYMTVKALVDPDDKSCEQLLSTDELTLVNKETEEILFCGFLENSIVTYQNDYKVVELLCVTASKNLDYEKKTRTFQGETMEAILASVFADYGTKAYYNKLDPSALFEIQYEETDFEFINRLVSQQELVVVPNVKDAKVRLYIDIKNKEKEYTAVGKNFHRVDNDQTESAYEESYYVFNENEPLSIGDIIHYNNMPLIITKLTGTIKDGLFTYEYHACLKNYIKRKAITHPYFAGSGMEGTVLQVDNRSVKVQFDVDQTQDISKAIWIPYGPIGCNAWYTMPHVGAKVMLQFQNHRPSSAIGISLGRQGADDIEDMSSARNKALTTKWGGRFRMTPSRIGFSNDYTELKLGDTIEVRSNDTLRLAADNVMNIGSVESEYIDSSGALVLDVRETKSIRMIATELLSMVVVNKAGGVELDREMVLSSLDNTECVGTIKKSYPLITVENDLSELDKAEPPEEEAEEDKGGFWNNIGKFAALAVATVAVVAIAVVAAPIVATALIGAAGVAASAATTAIVTGAVAGAAIGATIGVASTAAGDIYDDGVINTDAVEYLKSGTKGFLTGMVAGGAGASALGIYARVGIEAGGEFIVDIGEQLFVDGLSLKDVKWGQTAFNVGVGIFIGEGIGAGFKQGGKFLGLFKNSADEAVEEFVEETIENVTEDTLENLTEDTVVQRIDDTLIDIDDQGKSIVEEYTEYISKSNIEDVAENAVETNIGKEIVDEGAQSYSRLNYLREKYGKLSTEDINNRINLRSSTADQLEHLKNSSLTKKELGPAVAGVFDTKTGKTYFGINNIDGKAPSIQHDIISDKINNMPVEIRDSYIKTLGSGSHAEVNALNEALLNRPNADIGDFTFTVLSTRKINKSIVAGMPMPRCPHCEFITNGAKFFPEVLKYGK